jgi:uridine monophosphate synthetase
VGSQAEKSFFHKLETRIQSVDSLLCVGLDPHPQLLKEAGPGGLREFCLKIIAETADLACAFKPNSAFFEVYGAEGLGVLAEVIQAVPEGIPVILDAKRGDIASTASAYAQAAFQTLGVDAMTVSPYLGWDSLSPMVAPEKGIFLLCKTSNPGSRDFQDLILESGESLYIRIGRSVLEKKMVDRVGLVVGATDTDALGLVRAELPEVWILAPGVGAQGGELEVALRAGLRADGMGLILPISRSIALAEDRKSTAAEFRDRINRVRDEQGEKVVPPYQFAFLADYLLQVGCVKFGEYTLKSGVKSPIYIDLRILASYPKLLSTVATAYRFLIASLEFDRLAAIPLAALPIGTVIAIQSGVPLIYPRKEIKSHGTKAAIEGQYETGAKVLVDLVSSGESKFEAIDLLTSAGLVVEDVAVLIDREGGAREKMAQAGLQLHSVFKLSELIDHWETSGKVSAERANQVREFIKQPVS